MSASLHIQAQILWRFCAFSTLNLSQLCEFLPWVNNRYVMVTHPISHISAFIGHRHSGFVICILITVAIYGSCSHGYVQKKNSYYFSYCKIFTTLFKETTTFPTVALNFEKHEVWTAGMPKSKHGAWKSTTSTTWMMTTALDSYSYV